MSEYQYGATGELLAEPQPVTIGRYLLHRQIARGGMATIHIARLIGDEGFSRIVAAKRLLPEFAEDSEFVAMFLDEARIASKVHHRNVVPVLDVVTTGEEAILVQEYVHGAPLHWLLRAARQNKARIPLNIAVSVACQVLAGLHAAHETPDEMGMPLNIVHRDVSPQNVMVAIDGTARLLDFGVAKATMAAHVTREGQFKGKLAYSAPEQLRGQATRQSDLYSLAVLLWELIVGHRMHQNAQAEVELVATIMNGRLPTITEALASERDSIGIDRWRELQAIEPIIKTGLSVDVTDRWATAADMEQALIDVIRPAVASDVAAWLKVQGREFLDKHDRVLAAEEASWRRIGVTMQRRLAAVPNDARRGTQVSFTGDPSAPLSQPRPVAPSRRLSSNALIGLLCGLVVALAVGIVFAVRGPSGKSAAAEPAAATAAVPAAAVPAAAGAPASPAAVNPATASAPSAKSPAITTPSANTPAAALPAPAAHAAHSAETQAPSAPPTPVTKAADPQTSDTIELQVATPPPPPSVTHNASPPTRSVRPQPTRPSPSPTKKTQPAATTTTTVAPPPAAEPSTDCNPPYYYEGPKKIFKPNCI